MHSGPTLARERLEEALVRIGDPSGEGSRACLTVYADAAREAADAADARSRTGTPLGPLDGVIVSIKDLFDVRGEVTRAGSKALMQEGRVAGADAPAIHRLRAAGAVIVAKTSMSEFAFSGIGTNPHYGTPRNPLDRNRVPGGSSSGAAVAVADGFCDIGIGTDTGGSVRIPAALCGLVGFKPTKARIPTIGAYPLSMTLDSVGSIARTIDDCAVSVAIMSGQEPHSSRAMSLAGLRVGVAQGLVLDGLDSAVSEGFEGALAALSCASVLVRDVAAPEFDGMRAVNQRGGIATAEAFALHRHRLDGNPDIDPNILSRIQRGSSISAADYIDMIGERQALARSFDQHFEELDVLVMPTVPIVAPTFDQVSTAEGFSERNLTLLRNTAVANFFDYPAIALPLTGIGSSASLMLVGRAGQDDRLLSIARAVEACLAGLGCNPSKQSATGGEFQ